MSSGKKLKILTIFLILIIGGTALMGLFGCITKYTIRLEGNAEGIEGADGKFAAGQKVTLRLKQWDTDTDYTFYLDGTEISAKSFDHKNGFRIEFKMPDHDAVFRVESKRTMVRDSDRVPETEPDTDTDTEPVPDEDRQDILMLVDYYHATVATVGGDGYYEYVLSSVGDSETEARLDFYSRYEGDEEETHVSYSVPYSVIARVYEEIDSAGLRDWFSEEHIGGIDGAVSVVKFRDGEGYVRCSTDDMPEDGKERLDYIGDVLASYATDSNRIQEN